MSVVFGMNTIYRDLELNPKETLYETYPFIFSRIVISFIGSCT